MKLTRRHFVLLIFAVYFTFIGGTFYSQLNFPLRVAHQVVVTVMLGLWLAGRIRRGKGLRATVLDGPIALYLLANLLSALLGQSPRFSLEMMWFTLGHVLALYLLVDLLRRGWLQPLTWALYMAAAVVCLVGLAEFLAWYVGTPLFGRFAQGWLEIGGWRRPLPPVIYRLNITLNGSTPLSAYLALLIPPAIGLIMTLPRRDENRQALIVWLGLAGVVQILTFSRAGILALGVSLPVLLAGWLMITGRGKADIMVLWNRLKPGYRVWLALLGLGAAGVGLFWLQRSFAGRMGSTNFRLVLWQTAFRLFGQQPLAGVGPANFGRGLLRLNEADLPRQQIASAHSIYFNTAAELGLIGLAAGTVLFLAVGWAWYRRWQQTLERPARIRLIACGAALLGLAAQTLVDTYLATPNMLPLLGLVAFIVAGLPPRSALASRRPVAVGVLVMLLLYGGWFVRLARADFLYRQSFRAEGAGDLAGAVARAEQALALDPALALRTFHLARLEARLAHRSDNPAISEAAIQHYQAGLAREPVWGLNSANLAGLLWQQGRRTEAIEIMERTIAAQANPLFLVNLGYFYEQEEAWDRAVETYGRALAGAPGLAGSGFWQASPDRADRWPDLVAAAAGQVTAGAEQQHLLQAQLAAARQDYRTVETLIEPQDAVSDPPLRAILAATYLQRNQPVPAANLLAGPETAQDYHLRGWLKLQQADPAAAERLLKTAVFLGQPAAYEQLGQLYEQQGDMLAAEMAYRRGFSPHVISENEAVILYGRFSGNDLIPQLLRIGPGAGQAQPWLALARLYESQQRLAEAERVYRILLAEDPFLAVAREQLELLVGEAGR